MSTIYLTHHLGWSFFNCFLAILTPALIFLIITVVSLCLRCRWVQPHFSLKIPGCIWILDWFRFSSAYYAVIAFSVGILGSFLVACHLIISSILYLLKVSCCIGSVVGIRYLWRSPICLGGLSRFRHTRIRLSMVDIFYSGFVRVWVWLLNDL